MFNMYIKICDIVGSCVIFETSYVVGDDDFFHRLHHNECRWCHDQKTTCMETHFYHNIPSICMSTMTCIGVFIDAYINV